MSSIYNKIYLASPPIIQNCMVTIYGMVEYNRRFLGSHNKKLEELRLSANYSAEQFAYLQLTLLKKHLAHAIKEVPYYRNLFKGLSFNQEDIVSLEDLKYLPILEKEAVRRDPKIFYAVNLMKSKPLVFHTSGTTGTPLEVYCDKNSRRHHYAFWSRLREWNGLNYRSRRATLFGRILFDADANTSSFWRYDAIGKNLLMSSYHLSNKNLPLYIKKLENYQPEELIGYPSSISRLARQVIEEDKYKIRPRVVFTTAETLLENDRNLIEEAFKCPVIDQYGCVEMVIFASQCRFGRYHVHPEHGILEVLDENDNPVPPGEIGQAVCTGLVNQTMPLFRYRLGDRVQLSEKSCHCGFSTLTLKEVCGRVDDILQTPDGRPIGRLSPVWKVVNGIQNVQVVQNKINSLDINIVIDKEMISIDDCQKKIEFELRKRIGHDMNLNFFFLENIPTEKNAKFRSVISRINVL